MITEKKLCEMSHVPGTPLGPGRVKRVIE